MAQLENVMYPITLLCWSKGWVEFPQKQTLRLGCSGR